MNFQAQQRETKTNADNVQTHKELDAIRAELVEAKKRIQSSNEQETNSGHLAQLQAAVVEKDKSLMALNHGVFRGIDL